MMGRIAWNARFLLRAVGLRAALRYLWRALVQLRTRRRSSDRRALEALGARAGVVLVAIVNPRPLAALSCALVVVLTLAADRLENNSRRP